LQNATAQIAAMTCVSRFGPWGYDTDVAVISDQR
jgi:hypothetical protein